MNNKPYKRGIRDRLLSLFAALAVLAGMVSGFASGKTYDAEVQIISLTKRAKP